MILAEIPTWLAIAAPWVGWSLTVIGWIVQAAFQNRHKALERRRLFIAFMQYLISEAEIYRHKPEFPEWFQRQIPNLKREKALIVDDLTQFKSTRVDQLILEITGPASSAHRDQRIEALREIAALVNE